MANESNLQLTQILMNFTDVGGGGGERAEGEHIILIRHSKTFLAKEIIGDFLSSVYRYLSC